MCVKAININELRKQDMRFRVLALVVGEDRQVRRVDFNEIAKKLGVDRQLVSYHVHALVRDGYLLATPNGYAPTEQILFITT